MSDMFEFEWNSSELEKQLIELAGEEGLKDVVEETLQTIAKEVLAYVKAHVKVSEDNSKSGRKYSRPNGHARDNIPMSKIKRVKKDDFSYITVGWDKTDTSPWFYEKFQESEYGTSKIPPHPTFRNAKDIYGKQLDELFRKNLEKKLNDTIGRE